MLAYGFDAQEVSESHTAHSIAAQVAARHRVTVITRDDPSYGCERLQVVSIPTRAGFLSERMRRALKPDYFMFNLKAWRLVKSGRLGSFALCHHVSPISLRYPDILASLPIPFIWGPVGGSLPYPLAFRSLASTESALYKLRVLDSIRMRSDPFLRATMSRARAIVVTSRDAAGLIPAAHKDRTRVIGEGVDATMLSRLGGLPAGVQDGYVFSSARLVPSKGIEFLLRAFSRTALPRLVITGDGVCKESLLHLAGELNLSNRVTFLGAVSKETNLGIMANSRFCVFPSLKEAFGHVNLEAMALRKAVVAVAHGGPRDIVVDGITGILIDPLEPEYLVAQLAVALEQLHGDRQLCDSMGQAGYDRVVNEFSWERIGRRYLDLYDQIVRKGTETQNGRVQRSGATASDSS
jgi:glycosyltransferase involved in cell wall biosynthesis